MKNNRLLISITFEIIEILKIKLPNCTIKHLCKLANVSRSGYYNYLKTKHKIKLRQDKDEELKLNILKAMNFRGVQ